MNQFRDDIPYFHKSNGKEVAEWRLRVFQRRSTYDRLKQEGQLALLGLTSILTGLDTDGTVHRLEELSNANSVFESSRMYKIHSYKTNRRVALMPTKEYQRAEEGFQCFMGVVILSIEDLNDFEILQDFFELKKWIYRHMNSSASVDQVLAYLKWLTKACQSVFLKTQIPKEEDFFPRIKGDKTPFRSNKFAFIEKCIQAGCRSEHLTKEQAYCLSQIASGTRALPYPSRYAVSKQVEETCKLITTRVELSPSAKRSHRGGLRQIIERLHEPKDFRTHISLGNSACDELPKSEGGKATWLTSNAKLFCDQVVTPSILTKLVNGQDPMGFEVLNPATMLQVVKHITDSENILKIQVGDILYLDPGEATRHLEQIEKGGVNRLPKDLTKVILLEACKEILKFGEYNRPIKPNSLGLPIFEDADGLEFNPTVTEIPVTASLSIESALKSRLVTAAPAGYTELGQTINNFMRNYLSQDNFLRIGFDEPDKLWETLKAYEKRFFSKPKE